MRVDGHEWEFDGVAWSWNILHWRLGLARAVEGNGTPVGELWLCIGPLALCFV